MQKKSHELQLRTLSDQYRNYDSKKAKYNFYNRLCELNDEDFLEIFENDVVRKIEKYKETPVISRGNLLEKVKTSLETYNIAAKHITALKCKDLAIYVESILKQS